MQLSGVCLGPQAGSQNVIITASFIPLELWDVQRSFSVIKASVIAINVAIVWYLAAQIKIYRTTHN
jgi:uncharacterized membrane protein (DUF2068 family)